MRSDESLEYLYFLQQLREVVPNWLNELILFISEFVGGMGGLVLMAVIYWCISKRAGAFLMMNFSLAYVCNTVVKNIFCIERPFSRNTRLVPYVPVSGYSFPSGHTMLATGFYGGLAVWQHKRKWFAVLCVILTFLTAFTRNWLGAHTLEDVLVGIFCSICVIVLNSFLLKWVDEEPGRDQYIFIASALIFIVFCFLYPTSLKTAGIFGGVMFGLFIEHRFIRFEISKSIPFRIITFAMGIAVIGVLYKVVLPILLAPVENGIAEMLTYLVVFFMITAGWPMALKLLTKKCSKKGETHCDY